MSKKDGTPKQEPEAILEMSDLVGEAMTTYYQKHVEVISDLAERAQALFERIAPEHVLFAECYHESDELISCDVVDLQDGFGTLSLSFHPGPKPEADYFLIENYMELPSSIQIYSLYDLGRALCELTEVAQGVLKTFRRAMLGGTQSEHTSGRPE
jgi:hypothetical protein